MHIFAETHSEWQDSRRIGFDAGQVYQGHNTVCRTSRTRRGSRTRTSQQNITLHQKENRSIITIDTVCNSSETISYCSLHHRIMQCSSSDICSVHFGSLSLHGHYLLWSGSLILLCTAREGACSFISRTIIILMPPRDFVCVKLSSHANDT